MEIRNERELRDAYTDLRLWEKLLEVPNITKSVCYDYIKEIKKAIRKYNREDDSRRERKTLISKDGDYYGSTYLVELPQNIKSKEEATRYFIKNEFIEYRPTYYDCTGQHFTGWYKIFKRHDRFMAYHRIDIDC